MVQAMGMLGNSNRGLLPMQKYLLYRTCILPVATYGYRLWYHDKAKVKGLMSSLSRMQRWAALWIIGAFRMSPMGGCEAIAGLILIHLHIHRLADWSSFRASMLAAFHPLRTLLGPGRSMAAEPHTQSIYHMTAVKQTKVKSSLMEVNSKMLDVGEVFEPLCPELAPGRRFMDHFLERVTFFEKPRGMKPEDWTDTLDEAVDRACQLMDHVSVFSDTSSTKKDCLQAASVAFIEHHGLDLVQIKRPTGRATAPDAELFAICLGLLKCLWLGDVETILVFTDSVALARVVVDPSTHLGQSHSLAVIQALIPRLEADPLCKVQFWYVPSQARWDNHGKVHKYVTSTTGKVAVALATCATLNFCREKFSAQNLDRWDNMFNDPKYCGSSFLHLWGKEGKMPRPSSHKGGKWLQVFGSDVRLCAHASRAILNHAPIGAYCWRFHVGDRNYWCHCRSNTLPGVMGTLEDRHHLLTNCAAIDYPDYG
jgi:hypothetical protein